MTLSECKACMGRHVKHINKNEYYLIIGFKDGKVKVLPEGKKVARLIDHNLLVYELIEIKE